MTELNLQEQFELGVGAYDLSGAGGKVRPAPGTPRDYTDKQILEAYASIEEVSE